MALAIRHSSMSDHLIGFAAYLRSKNYKVGLDDVVDALKALHHINLGNRDEFLQVLQITFASTSAQWHTIGDDYHDFLVHYKKSLDSKNQETDPVKKEEPTIEREKKRYQLADIKKWLYNQGEDEVETPYFSPYQSEDDKDLSLFRDGHDQALIQRINRLVKKLAAFRSRRNITHSRKGLLDQRILIRNRVKNGDELIHLSFKYRRKEKSKVILLCDVSKSMDLYSHFISHFIHALRASFAQHAIYVFNTGLHAINEAWLDRDWNSTLEALQEIPGLWLGGTQIGKSISDLLYQLPVWFDHRTKVIIFSDGWDVGNLDLLSRGMKELQEHSGLVLWMNPVLKKEAEMEIGGMQAARPHIDILAPVYNLRTLDMLIDQL